MIVVFFSIQSGFINHQRDALDAVDTGNNYNVPGVERHDD